MKLLPISYDSIVRVTTCVISFDRIKGLMTLLIQEIVNVSGYPMEVYYVSKKAYTNPRRLNIIPTWK